MVDDKKINRVLLVKLLTSLDGLDVREAENGQEAVAILGRLAAAFDLDGHAHAGDGRL